MKSKRLFVVSDWETYSVAEAFDHHGAIEKVYPSKNYRLISKTELTEHTVTHAMCCEYTAQNMDEFNSCFDESAIVLMMDGMDETLHYQLSTSFYA
ncbi:conserved hypothetical protein [Vibrio chagasii]|nr:conserved hypothetical protein [Vibrio chagasii]CAH7003738.1 conserved hypothetical protein [Vibrio chagasii]CAH7010113.1 conserved hypothetical protein [Vibrio chagasii]CAH7091855.1 conserved hypothetical protein [Vibrio chagasii]CAH7143032.1 conserved hypothetical protein [Vibrio chagasii]